MFSAIYIEKDLLTHPRAIAILQRFSTLPVISIDRYGEVFNRGRQNFRLQKTKPALILAQKKQGFVLAAPEAYGIGGARNYYFSHMLNCLYDCRYCFLQGMFRSAHYVLFLNYEDFAASLANNIARFGTGGYYFSGYDCDSLALEPVTGFLDYFLPFFQARADVWLEIRTKSTQIRRLLNTTPSPNCIIAFSFTPEEISMALEHKVPSIEKRIHALNQLQHKGWPIALRFDPLIYSDDYQAQYKRLFETIFTSIDGEHVHSVSLGAFRLPVSYYKNIRKLYPLEKLFASHLDTQDGMVSYPPGIEAEMGDYCAELLDRYVAHEKQFSCISL